MNRKQKKIKRMLEPIIKGINSVPEGVVVPSEWSAPNGYTLERVEICGISVEHLVPKEKKTNKVIYQLHGGAYVVSLIDYYREAAVQYSNIAGGAEVYSIDYRIAPDNLYPSALEDSVKVYKWILEQGNNNEDIIIIGDSAGGNLALSTTLYLRDNGIPLPKGVILLSPWSNINDTPKSRVRNMYKDLLLGKNALNMRKEVLNSKYAGKANKMAPYVSPYYGDYKGCPNLLIQVGSYEVLLDDSLEVAKRAKNAGVYVRQTTYKEMSHDFQLLLPSLRESKAAWKEMKRFISNIYKK